MNKNLIDKLSNDKCLTQEEFVCLIENFSAEDAAYAEFLARSLTDEIYGHDIYMRGLIEFTNYCKNDCYYCGIRCSNKKAERYRLSFEEVLLCADAGYELGFRTFVLQGGEDPWYNCERTCELVASIKERYPECAVTLSIGEKSRKEYQALYDAGAERYLLRHETADAEHYAKLHPASLSLENRKRCLYDLKDIGFQVGTGFMVGSPYQTSDCIARDLIFIHDLNPHMIGIGPFIPHKDTQFADMPQGSVELTIFLISLLRIMVPAALIPATTALGTLDSSGRERGIYAGSNVLMPNISPADARNKYLLYDGKLQAGDVAAESQRIMNERLKAIGFSPVVARGDSKVK